MIYEHIKGYIVDLDDTGTLHITAKVPSMERTLKREYEEVEVILQDGRKISPAQRRKCYALLGEIAEYSEGIRNSDTVESAKKLMKIEFRVRRMESMERQIFSLSDCDCTLAKEFISFLIDFIIEEDIPTNVSLIDNCEDITRYVYSCLINKKCCVCGKKAQLHHVQSVGSQGYRDKINHIGLEALPLCADHHTESHTIGQESFMGKYHLKPVIIDKKIAQIYKLKSK